MLDTTKKNTSKSIELYSKNVIGIFTFLFSAIFGAFLLMYNLRKLNYQKQSIIVLTFGVLYTTVSIYLLYLVNNNTNVAILLNLGGLYFMTTFFWNKYIGKEFEYMPKKPLKLILISLIIIALFIFLFLYGHLILVQLF